MSPSVFQIFLSFPYSLRPKVLSRLVTQEEICPQSLITRYPSPIYFRRIKFEQKHGILLKYYGEDCDYLQLGEDCG